MRPLIKPTLCKLPAGNWRAWNRKHNIRVYGQTRPEAEREFAVACHHHGLTVEAETEAFNRAVDPVFGRAN